MLLEEKWVARTDSYLRRIISGSLWPLTRRIYHGPLDLTIWLHSQPCHGSHWGVETEIWTCWWEQLICSWALSGPSQDWLPDSDYLVQSQYRGMVRRQGSISQHCPDWWSWSRIEIVIHWIDISDEMFISLPANCRLRLITADCQI